MPKLTELTWNEKLVGEEVTILRDISRLKNSIYNPGDKQEKKKSRCLIGTFE